MAKYVLIDGGVVRKSADYIYETENVDVGIVKMTGKSNSNFLFIDLANAFSVSCYDTMKKIYRRGALWRG